MHASHSHRLRRSATATLALLSACQSHPMTLGEDKPIEEEEDAAPPPSGMSFALQRYADVTAVELLISRVPLADEPDEPAITSRIVELGLRSEGEDPGMDTQIVLEPGCYDVLVRPLQKSGAPSALCAAMLMNDVCVIDGTTTELAIVSQCDPPEDEEVLDAFESSPVLDDLWIEPDDLEPQAVCATFHDPDEDPIEVIWSELRSALFGPAPIARAPRRDPDTGKLTQCMEVPGAVTQPVIIEVTVYDMMKDPKTGALVRRETWFAQNSVACESHDSGIITVSSGQPPRDDGS